MKPDIVEDVGIDDEEIKRIEDEIRLTNLKKMKSIRNKKRREKVLKYKHTEKIVSRPTDQDLDNGNIDSDDASELYMWVERKDEKKINEMRY